MTSFASSSRWLRLAVLVGALLAAAARPCHADPAREFRQHYEAALRFYDSGQFEGAIKEFQAAYALKQLPRLLLNIGQAHRKLGHARDALGFYEFYLRVEPNPKPEIRAELTTYIAQTRMLLDAAERMRAEQKGEPAAGTEQTPLPAGPSSGGPSPPGTPATAAPASPGGIGATAASGATPAPAATTATPDTRLQVSSAPALEHRTTDSAAARPVYKKWSFREYSRSDGGSCLYSAGRQRVRVTRGNFFSPAVSRYPGGSPLSRAFFG